jgi:K+-transporting ATPase A subunit
MVENMDMQYYNYFKGYTRWIQRYGLQYYAGLWVADSLGMMSNCNEAYNSLETQFPIFSESTWFI